MKVALVYDRVNKWGGAERVLLALHKIFPDAPLFTSVYHSEKAKWAKVFDVKTSFLQKIPKAKTSHEFLAAFMPFAFESFSFDDYDVVISVTSEAAKGVITSPKTKHICICLTTTRYLWSGYDEYFKNKLLKLFAKPAVLYLRAWDKKSSHNPDILIAISNEVKDRIKKYYGRESIVIYPPVEISNFKFQISNNSQKNNLQINSSEYFLIVSRLVPYKKIEIAIQACNELKLPLKVVGTGSMEKKLKKISGPTIEFLGNLTDEDLSKVYKNAKALIFPGLEDFGIVMVEAQVFGKPVIAFRGGGAKEIIIEGKTGEFFDEQNKASLIKVLKKFDESSYNTKDCQKNAERFSFERFENELEKYFNI